VSELLRVADKHLKKALEQIEDSREEAETWIKNIANPVVADIEAGDALAYLVEAFNHENSLLKAAGGISGNNIPLIMGNTLNALKIIAEGMQALYARSDGERLTYTDGGCPPPCIRYPICIELTGAV